MKILAIDSSAKAASVAIVEDGKILGETFLNCGLTHSVTIMPSVEWLLETTGIKLSDIDRIAICEGPGSFTGLRIGMAAVKGLAWSLDIPCVGVSTLYAAARGVSHVCGTICAVMDARAGQVYNAVFKSDGKNLSRVCDDRAIETEKLISELENGFSSVYKKAFHSCLHFLQVLFLYDGTVLHFLYIMNELLCFQVLSQLPY